MHIDRFSVKIIVLSGHTHVLHATNRLVFKKFYFTLFDTVKPQHRQRLIHVLRP